MRVRPFCAACMLLTRAKELESIAGLNIEDALASFRTITESTGVYLGPDIELTLLATASFRRLKSILGNNDVYADMRARLEPKVHEAIKSIEEVFSRLEGEEKFRFAVKVAAAGNALDPARPYLEHYVHNASSVKKIELRRNDFAEVYPMLLKGGIKSVAYVFDNSLEAYYDSFLIRVLQENGATVTGVVKSEKYEDDLTIEELKRYGLANLLDDVVETGSDAASLLVDEVDEHALRVVEDADLVVVKGSLNYLHFRNNPLRTRVYALMRVPCRFLAYELGVPVGSYVAVRV